MTVLDTILERKRQEVAEALARKPPAEVRREAAEAGPPRGFLRALREADPPALIAEIKRASPSKGLIREDFDPPALARAYERGGAACLSVLTDHDFFQGALADLTRARRAVRLPVLRKDFLIDEYQVYEARAAGADAALLIVAALDDAALRGFLGLAGELGMDALVEVHDEEEMERAAAAGATLIGINNRDLRTFETDLAVTRRLAALAPEGALLVSESGVFTPEDARTVREAGARAVLVGEALMREADVEQAVRRLLGR